jgi:hypothetical protein
MVSAVHAELNRVGLWCDCCGHCNTVPCEEWRAGKPCLGRCFCDGAGVDVPRDLDHDPVELERGRE